MRVWALASCGGMFMLTTYIAFRHDANAQKVNNDLLLGRTETNQDDTSIPEVSHLQAVSQPELQGQLTSFVSPSANSQPKADGSASPVQAQQPRVTVVLQEQTGSSGPWQSPPNSAVSASLARAQSTQPASLQAAEKNLPVPTAPQNRVNISAHTELPSEHQAAVEATQDVNNTPVTAPEDVALNSPESAIAAQPASVNLFSDIVHPGVTANATAPSAGLSQGPQFSSNGVSAPHQAATGADNLTQSPGMWRPSLKPTDSKLLEPALQPQLPYQRQLTIQPEVFPPVANSNSVQARL